MKKLLLSASTIALTFSFLLHTAHAMEKENLDIDMDVETPKTTAKRKADNLDDNSGMNFGTQNQNNMREANAIEDNSGTKKVKTEDTRIAFPLENLFPILKDYYLPNELTVKIVQALGSEDRKAYSLVNHQWKNFIDFCTTNLSLKIDLKKFKFDSYYEPHQKILAPMANFDFLLMFPHLESLQIAPNLVLFRVDFQYLTRLKRLDLKNNYFIEDDAISILTNLVELNLGSNRGITNIGITSLTKLKKLNLPHKDKITDDALSVLTNLESLNLGLNRTITNNGITLLTKLKTLVLSYNNEITDDSVSGLTNLENLKLGGNQTITNKGITSLTKLKKLNLCENDEITDDALSVLTNLESLNLDWNSTITNNGITSLTKLKTLNLCENDQITDDALRLFTNLTDLNLGYCDTITDTGLRSLTNLKKLNIIASPHITGSSIENLKKLRFLSFDVDKFNIVSLITKCPSLNILELEENRTEGQKATQNLIDLINHLFFTADNNQDNIDGTEFLALKTLYEVKLLPHILNPQEDEQYTSTYPINTFTHSMEDVKEIIEKREELKQEDGTIIPFCIMELLMDDGLDLVNRLFAINKMDTKLICH